MAGRGPRPRVPSPMGKGDREAVDEVIPSEARSARKTALWAVFSGGRAAAQGGAPGKQSGGLFSVKAGRQPRTSFQRRAGGSPGRSARKTVRWTVFSRGRQMKSYLCADT